MINDQLDPILCRAHTNRMALRKRLATGEVPESRLLHQPQQQPVKWRSTFGKRQVLSLECVVNQASAQDS